MARSSRLKLPEYVTELVEAGIGVLTAQLGLSDDRARELMYGVAREVCFRHAKSTVYIPEAIQLANIERNARIWAEYQRDNPAAPHTKKFTPQRIMEIARDMNLSPQMVYSITRGEHDAEKAQVQPMLPGVPEQVA